MRETPYTGRDIGEIPAVVDMARKQRAKESFRAFCEAYFPHRFSKPWEEDQLAALAASEEAVLSKGGVFRFRLGRDRGTTTILEALAMWALHTHPYVLVIGFNSEAGITQVENIKEEYEHNTLLLQDWPEICVPIREASHWARFGSQLCCGEPTSIRWAKDYISLPRIASSSVSGHALRTVGFNSGLAGMIHQCSDGTRTRPTLVVIDDVTIETLDAAQSARALRRLRELEHMSGPKRPTTLLIANG